MATYTTKLSLQDAAFPLLSRNGGRSALVAQIDANVVNENAASGLASNASSAFNNVAKPHVIYVENVMPRAGGFSSVGYMPVSNAISGMGTVRCAFSTYIRNRHSSPETMEAAVVVFSSFASKLEYKTAYLHGTVDFSGFDSKQADITWGSVGGRTYFLLVNATTRKLYELYITSVGTAATVDEITPIGIDPTDYADIRFCCAAGNYLILAKEDGTLYWNDPNSVVDYTPSLITGAGSEIPAILTGIITGLQSLGDGFIIHTTTGSLFARYSQNPQNPWIFLPVYNSAPVRTSRISGQLSKTDGTLQQQQFLWSTSGLLELSIVNNAVSVFPEVSDFLSAELTEVLYPDVQFGNPKLVSPSGLNDSELDIGLTRIGSRYLCISYGHFGDGTEGTAAYYTQALIYDISLKRWGKLVVNHVAIVELPITFPCIDSLHNIGIVDNSGNVVCAYEESTYTLEGVEHLVEHLGVVILGGISLVRGHMAEMQAVEISYGDIAPPNSEAEAIKVFHAGSYDAMNLGKFQQLKTIDTGTGTLRCMMRKVAKYHNFKIFGNFRLTHFEGELLKAGTR